MKKIIGFIIGALITFIGFINIIIANIEMSTARGYTFRPPYTEYEAGVIITKYIVQWSTKIGHEISNLALSYFNYKTLTAEE